MRYILFIILLIPFAIEGQSLNVIPMPQEVSVTGDYFVFDKNVFGQDSINTIHYLKDHFGTVKYKMLPGGMRTIKFSTLSDKQLYLKVLNEYDSQLAVEGYRLSINKDSVKVSANGEVGFYNGICTIDQMLTNSAGAFLPCCEIKDYPAYSYRGTHLDVCRHFFSKDFIKRYIDVLAYYKINTFHWHLTDDQGWRIEIMKYPKLTDIGAWRTEKDGSRYGGYYTQSDIREIVAYARSRYITIVPEIEMPGHSSAALAAYPELGCTGDRINVANTWGIKKDIYAPTDSVFRFFEDVMDEVCELFPSTYIHIGGDEAPKAQWKNSTAAQAVMKQNNLKNEEELQQYFMHRVEQYLNTKGRTAIGWGEVVRGGLSDNMVVMSWLDKSAGIKAAKHGNDVIMAPRGYCYFDYPQKGDKIKAIWMLPLPLSKVYAFDPNPKKLSAEAAKHIIGGEATLWTEYVTTEEQAMHQLMPRLAAMAEALWTKPAAKNYKDFVKRVGANTVKQ